MIVKKKNRRIEIQEPEMSEEEVIVEKKKLYDEGETEDIVCEKIKVLKEEKYSKEVFSNFSKTRNKYY